MLKFPKPPPREKLSKKHLKYFKSGKSKYGSIKQTYEGYSYASKKEAQKAWELDQLKKSEKIKGWRRQVKVDLFGEKGTRICGYKVDFLIEHLSGVLEYLEVKGFPTREWALKWKLLQDKLGKDKHYKLTVEY
jgi:hypothetical protein